MVCEIFYRVYSLLHLSYNLYSLSFSPLSYINLSSLVAIVVPHVRSYAFKFTPLFLLSSPTFPLLGLAFLPLIYFFSSFIFTISALRCPPILSIFFYPLSSSSLPVLPHFFFALSSLSFYPNPLPCFCVFSYLATRHPLLLPSLLYLFLHLHLFLLFSCCRSSIALLTECPALQSPKKNIFLRIFLKGKETTELRKHSGIFEHNSNSTKNFFLIKL